MTESQQYALAIGLTFLFIVSCFVFLNRGKEREKKVKGLAKDWADLKDQTNKVTNSLSDLFTTYHQSSPEERAQFKQEVGDYLPFTRTYLNSKTNHLVVVGPIIVTYQFAGLKFISASQQDVARVDGRIREILTANPRAELGRLEVSLGINIVDIQGQAESTPTPRSEPITHDEPASPNSPKSKDLKDVIL